MLLAHSLPGDHPLITQVPERAYRSGTLPLIHAERYAFSYGSRPSGLPPCVRVADVLLSYAVTDVRWRSVSDRLPMSLRWVPLQEWE